MLSFKVVDQPYLVVFFQHSLDSTQVTPNISTTVSIKPALRMPPARRKSAQASGKPQPTLSFNAKTTKVTKPAAADPSIKKSTKAQPGLAEAITEDAPTSEVAIRQQVKVELAKPKDEATLRAEKVTDAQVKEYWKKEENLRKAPRGTVDG